MVISGYKFIDANIYIVNIYLSNEKSTVISGYKIINANIYIVDVYKMKKYGY